MGSREKWPFFEPLYEEEDSGVKAIVDKLGESKYIFIVGIGGSDLAGKALWSALKHKHNKRLFFVEAPDKTEYEELQNFIKNEIAYPENVCFFVISKSGETAETLSSFHNIFDMLSEKFGAPIGGRGVVITTPGSPLSTLGKENGLEEVPWYKDVGGRFSAFTITHTLPLKITGLDTANFLKGAREASENSSPETKEWAAKIFDSYKNGIDVLNFFVFERELEDLGKWCRQLIAESLATITPTVSVGPTDLHSMLELYLERPDSGFTIFLESKKEIENSVNEDAYKNVTDAYEKNSIAFAKYEIEEITEENLGKFMAFMMLLTVELARLLEIDPFDQPAVENYKKDIISKNES